MAGLATPMKRGRNKNVPINDIMIPTIVPPPKGNFSFEKNLENLLINLHCAT
jgi:hypothetical protein